MKFEVRPVETSSEEKLYTGPDMANEPGLYQMVTDPKVKYLSVPIGDMSQDNCQLIAIGTLRKYPYAVYKDYPSSGPEYVKLTNHQVILTVED